MAQMNRSVWGVVAGAAVVVAGWSLSSVGQEGGQRQNARVARIATADVLGIVERMLASDRYRPAQEAFLRQENERLRPLADELVAIESRGSRLPQGPELEKLGREFEEKQQAFQQARQDAFARIEAYNADQVREAYRLTLAAVDELSERLGYTHVLSTRSGEPTIRSTNVPGALQEILARPVAKADPADDLTDRLLRQLNLEDVKLEEPPPPPPTPAATPVAPGTPDRAPLPPR